MNRASWTSRSSSPRSALGALVLLLGLAPPAAAAAEGAVRGASRGAVASSDEFNAHYRRALQLYRARDYAGTERELLLAYEIKPLPALLLNLGHAELDQGHGAEALAYYARYLKEEQGLTEAQRVDVARYQEQARKLAPVAAPRAFWQRPLGRAAIGLSVVGAALVITGIGTGSAALVAADQVVQGEGTFNNDLDQRGRALSQAAIACDVIGGVALATGAVLTVINLLQARGQRPPVAAPPVLSAASLALQGRF